MEPYFVFDLRNNHFVAGVVDSFDGKLRWKSEKVQTWLRQENYDSVDEADLCFFRHSRDKGWKPTSPTALSNLSDEYEKITNLFEEPDERLKTIIIPALRSLYKPLLRQHEELEILFLIDTIRVKEYLTELPHQINRPCQIIVTPENTNMLAGFSLLNVKKHQLPQKGKILACTIEGISFSYRWNEVHFEAVMPDGVPSKHESEWAKFSDMERVGSISFELIWSEKLVSIIKEDLGKLITKNNMLSRLFVKMDQIYSELQELSSSRLIKQD
jgi:hypothetical protein